MFCSMNHTIFSGLPLSGQSFIRHHETQRNCSVLVLVSVGVTQYDTHAVFKNKTVSPHHWKRRMRRQINRSTKINQKHDISHHAADSVFPPLSWCHHFFQTVNPSYIQLYISQTLERLWESESIKFRYMFGLRPDTHQK